MASGAVSSTLSMSVDRTDAADRMGHESANLAAKATATAYGARARASARPRRPAAPS